MHRRPLRSAFEPIFPEVHGLRTDAKRARERPLARTTKATSSTLAAMFTGLRVVLFATVTSVALGCGAAREPATVTLDRDGSAAPPPLVVVGSPNESKPAPRSRIEWVDAKGEASARDRATRERRSVLVYFSATWCAACAELEKTFRDRRVLELTTDGESIHVDATDDDDPKVIELVEKYRVIGLPTLVIIDTRGSEVARITEYVTGPKLAAALEKARP